ncbi:unnamed protein product [Gadus morhua 'NCC']
MEVSAAPCREPCAEEQEASSNVWEALPSVIASEKSPRLKGQEEGPDLLHVGRQSVHPSSKPAPCLLFGGGTHSRSPIMPLPSRTTWLIGREAH